MFPNPALQRIREEKEQQKATARVKIQLLENNLGLRT